MQGLILAAFFLAYAGIALKRDKALYFVYGAAVFFLITGAIFIRDIPVFLNYNVLGIFLGTSILSFLFSFSGVPSGIVENLSAKKYPTGIIYLLICLMTSLISAFVENVATIMIMAPVALELAKKHKLNPVPLLIGMAVSSNLQGCATMVGDSPSIILAMEAGMTFNDFIYMPAAKLSMLSGRPGIFFFVQAGAAAGMAVLYFFFRKEKKSLEQSVEAGAVKLRTPGILIILMIISLALASFVGNGFEYFPAVICLFYASAGLLWFTFRKKEEKFTVRHIDWESFFLLAGIFILVGTLKKAGFIEGLAGLLEKTGEQSPFLLYNIIVWGSVFISSFVDNIPYTMAMIAGVQILCARLSLNPYIFLFGLLLGTCVGGNITPIGASCNVVSVGILRKNGYRAGFKDFAKIGLPFTILAVLASTLLMWAVYR
ncbi:MAG: hypothetical protein JW957_03030 [Candidatus Omnitrophica bacterium]|nr:hypothetical protein [Candidatus Omnitrophota bacterium]